MSDTLTALKAQMFDLITEEQQIKRQLADHGQRMSALFAEIQAEQARVDAEAPTE